MNYRKAEIADIPTLIHFRKALLKREDDNSIDAELANYFETAMQDGMTILWVAEDGGKVVSSVLLGVMQMVPRFDNSSGKVAYLTNMYTLLEYRRRGIATNLMKNVIEVAKSQGIKKILLHSSEMAKPVYENLGFEEGTNYYVMKL
jgi:GNAT superfamily N-acetyltransferase